MRVASSINSIRRRRAQAARVLTIFFLIYTGADLFVPQYFCSGEEVGNLPQQTRLVKTDAGTNDGSKTVATYSSQSSQSNQSPEPAPHEEDCFCCCAHVLPGTGFVALVISEATLLRVPPFNDSLLSPPLRSTYHPPRFA